MAITATGRYAMLRDLYALTRCLLTPNTGASWQAPQTPAFEASRTSLDIYAKYKQPVLKTGHAMKKIASSATQARPYRDVGHATKDALV